MHRPDVRPDSSAAAHRLVRLCTAQKAPKPASVHVNRIAEHPGQTSQWSTSMIRHNIFGLDIERWHALDRHNRYDTTSNHVENPFEYMSDGRLSTGGAIRSFCCYQNADERGFA